MTDKPKKRKTFSTLERVDKNVLHIGEGFNLLLGVIEQQNKLRNEMNRILDRGLLIIKITTAVTAAGVLALIVLFIIGG